MEKAVDWQVSRWRQIQHQAEMHRMAKEKAEADQREEAGEQQADPAHEGDRDQTIISAARTD